MDTTTSLPWTMNVSSDNRTGIQMTSWLSGLSTTPLPVKSEPASVDLLGSIVDVINMVGLGVVCSVGLLLNFAIIFCFFASPKLRSAPNVLVVALAFADMLFVACAPLVIHNKKTGGWKLGGELCRTWHYLVSVGSLFSAYIIVILAADRYAAITCRARSSPRRRFKNTSIAVVVLFAIVSVLSIPRLWEYDSHTYKWIHLTTHKIVTLDRCLPCADKTGLNLDCLLRSSIAYCVVQYVLPVGSICVLYSKLLVRVRGYRATFLASGKQLQQNMVMVRRYQQRCRQVTQIAVLLVLVFFFSWMPYHAAAMAFSLNERIAATSDFFLIVSHLSTVVAYLTSVWNPIMYTLLSRPYRRTFMQLCRCGRGGDDSLRTWPTRLLTFSAETIGDATSAGGT